MSPRRGRSTIPFTMLCLLPVGAADPAAVFRPGTPRAGGHRLVVGRLEAAPWPCPSGALGFHRVGVLVRRHVAHEVAKVERATRRPAVRNDDPLDRVALWELLVARLPPHDRDPVHRPPDQRKRPVALVTVWVRILGPPARGGRCDAEGLEAVCGI